MRVSINDLAKTANLAGATLGAQHLHKVAAKISCDDEIVILDFTGVESATGSYLKALVFGFLEDPAAKLKGAFPVVTRMNSLVREELVYLTSLTTYRIVEGLKFHGDEVVHARLHGELDPALKTTLDVLLRRGAASATELHAKGGESIAITAWNNRLADLYAKRLVMRRRAGKQWLYEPISREFDNG